MWARALLSCFGLGFLPGPTGTYASAATVGLLVWLHGPGMGPLDPGIAVAVILGSVVTVVLGNRLPRDAGKADPSWVVTDEVAGQALALSLAAAVSRSGGWWPVLAAFLLFRLFDILKPGVIRDAERLPGGLGILADDLLAGAAAGALVALFRPLEFLGA